MTAAEVRVPRARLIVAAAALCACGALLWLSRTYTFYFDEWTFIQGAPGWTLATYFQPHNEHPSLLFRVIYSALLHTAGLRSYLPYVAVLLAAHFANVMLLFELVRRRAGDLVAIAAAALLMLLGAGWEDLLWAFQMAWLGSVAFGLAMLIALDGPSTRRRLASAAACLLASLMLSGIGVPFAIAAAVWLLVCPGRRRDLAWFVPVAAAAGAWYVGFGRFAGHPNPQPTVSNLLIDPLYALWGLSQSAGGLVGVGGWPGVAILAFAAAALGWRWRRHGADGMLVGVTVGLAGFYLVTGLTRAQLGVMQAGASRYVYVAASLWIVLLADAARSLPWRGTWRPALAACVFLAVFNSAVLLVSFAAARTILMERQVADYYALAAERTDPCLDPQGAVDPLVMPAETQPSAYYLAVDGFGDPIDGAPLLDRASYNAGVHRLRRADCVRP